MRKLFALFFVIGLFIFFTPQAKADTLASGDLIKASQASVYYYGADGKRYVFPNEKTYKTWYADYSSVKTITDAELAAIQIGGNVTYRAGVKMVKIQTDPKVYAVAKYGTLRWIKTEEIAKTLYGDSWNSKIEDIPDAFFVNYTVGSDIMSATDFVAGAEEAADAIVHTVCCVPAPPEKTYIWNAKTINSDSYVHNDLDFINYNGGYLALWNDDRHGQQEVMYQKTGVTAAGTGDVVRITSNIQSSDNSSSYFDGNILYIFWEDSSLLKRAIYLQRRDILGNQISQGLFASTTYATSKYPAIDYNSTLGEYGVAWWDSRYAVFTAETTKGDIYFVRMKDGLKTGATFRVSESSLNEFSPQVVSVKDKFAILWQDDNFKIKLAFVDKNTALVGSIVDVATATKAVSPRLVWNGEYAGIVWADKSGNADDIFFAEYDADGAKITAPVAISTDVGGASEPDILWTGSKFYVSYTGATSQNIYLAKIASNGNVSKKDINISYTSEKSYSSKLAKTSAGTIGVAWLEDAGTANKIMGAVETEQ